MSHEDIAEKVRRWATYEKQLKVWNDHIRNARENRAQLAVEIGDYIERHPNTKLEVNGSVLRTVEKRDYAPLTFTYIETCLGKLIPDESQRETVMTYLKDQRDVHTTRELRTYSTSRGRTQRKRERTMNGSFLISRDMV